MRKKLILLLIIIFTSGIVVKAESPMPTEWRFYVDSPNFLLIDNNLGSLHSYYNVIEFAAAFGAEVEMEIAEDYHVAVIKGLHMNGRVVTLVVEEGIYEFIIAFGGLDMDDIYDIFVETEQIAIDEDDFFAILEEQGIYWGDDMAIYSEQPEFEGYIMPIVQDDVFYVPLRFAATVFGFIVDWQGDLVLLTNR